MRKPNFTGMIVAGGSGGALLVSVVTHLLYMARYPSAIYDGQYGMIFMGTAPFGWLLGSVAGTGVAWRASTRPRRAGWVAGLLIVCGVAAGPFLGLAGVMSVSYIWLLLHQHR